MSQISAFGSLRRVKEMLQGLKVLDASRDIAGHFCARLMADNCASVTLATDADASSASVPSWRHLNAGKKLEISDVADQQIFAERIRGLDIVICSSPWQVQACRHTDDRIIAILITPFGQRGPYSAWCGTEMIYQALSGSMPNNGKAGMPPLYGCGDRASIAAGVMAYCGAMAAVVERGVSQKGQNVDVAIAEVAAAMTTGAVAFGYSGKAPAIRTAAQSMICCSGEWVLLRCYPFQWQDFCIALDALDLYQDRRFAEQADRAVNWHMLLEILQDRLGDRTADEIVARLRGRKLITAKSERPSRMGDDPHLNARDYWQEHDGRRVLGSLFRGYRSEEDPEKSPFDNRLGREIALPLSGLRVFDLTTAWAGPMAGRNLAFLGADVIHVEHASKPDLWRHHRQVYNDALYVEGENPERRHNRNALFNSQNINKRSLSLDLKSPEGARLGKQIAEHCDVILTNFTPGTLDRLGIGYKALSPSNPDVIVCEMPAYGLYGPQSDALAVGATMEMAAAMSAMVGYRDGMPTTTGPHLPDPIGGLNATAAILTALVHRQMHGGGQLVEVAQVEAAMQYVGLNFWRPSRLEQIPFLTATGSAIPPRTMFSPLWGWINGLQLLCSMMPPGSDCARLSIQAWRRIAVSRSSTADLPIRTYYPRSFLPGPARETSAMQRQNCKRQASPPRLCWRPRKCSTIPSSWNEELSRSSRTLKSVAVLTIQCLCVCRGHRGWTALPGHVWASTPMRYWPNSALTQLSDSISQRTASLTLCQSRRRHVHPERTVRQGAAPDVGPARGPQRAKHAPPAQTGREHGGGSGRRYRLGDHPGWSRKGLLGRA